MTFINYQNEIQAGVPCGTNVFNKVSVLTIADGNIVIFIQKLPVDKTAVIFRKTAGHHIGKKLCLGTVNVGIHFLFALLFKVTLTRRKPDKNSVCVALQVFVHKVGEHDSLSATSAGF